ncbi:YczE/YyaS/YitT family protein [Romboutsia sp. Marseille-P6047]|uniref:YczE/YyaS/YitT family protein n=1 Tax=Romboutsia sp. Marseille-P6047 TaxID=2161817 RepID=UPI000F06BDCF|nr:hypothetical protein [Romboutsia sp. Marseille-P6047]
MNEVTKQKNKRLLIMIIGNIILGIGITLFRNLGFGVDPFMSMTIGISNKFSIQLGIFQMCLNIGLFVILFSLIKKLMGLGTIVNMLFLGYMVQYFSFLYGEFLAAPSTILGKLILLLVALLVQVIGMSLYITADLGIAPYDCLPIILSEKTRFEFGIWRVFCDTICVILAIVFGGSIGISTLIIAFGTGPLVQFFNKYFEKKILKKNIDINYMMNDV